MSQWVPFVPARIVQQKRKLMKEPRVELVVKSSSEENAGEGGLEESGRDVLGSVRAVRPFRPATNGKNEPRQNCASEESVAEGFADENFFGKEAEVDGPSVREDAREFECFCDVLNWVRGDKWESKSELNGGANREQADPRGHGKPHDHDAEQAWRHQQDVHLDGDREREPNAAHVPALFHEEVNRSVSEEHREAVVEAPKHEDGVNSLGQQKENAKAFGEPREAEDFHCKEGNCDIHKNEDALREEDVSAVVGDVVQSGIEIHEPGGIHKGSGVSLQLCVI